MSLLNLTGISTAFAETDTAGPVTTTATTSTSTGTPPSQSANFLHMLPMLILFVAVFYFLLIRPQAKRAKEQKKLMSGIAVGDEVMTTGGIIGRVVSLKDNYAVLTIAKGVNVTMQKGSIASVLPKGTMESTD